MYKEYINNYLNETIGIAKTIDIDEINSCAKLLRTIFLKSRQEQMMRDGIPRLWNG